MNMRNALFTANVRVLEELLSADPSLANAGIPLFDTSHLAHPLHRICDAISKIFYTEEIGIDVARLLIRHGADVNHITQPGMDSPLTAACSLACDQLALFYLAQGANVHHQGCHGGTALHWAAWCGRDKVVEELLMKYKPEINEKCIDFKSTPLFWAIHGYKSGGENNRNNQLICTQLLLDKGANKNVPNAEGKMPIQLLSPEDSEFLVLLKGK